MSIDIAHVAVVLLAGGQATRFGSDKLSAPLDDVPLALHAARTLAAMPFARHIVVTGPTSLDLTSLHFVHARVPAGTVMSGSIAAGMALVQRTDCEACLIALADMPLVPQAHFAALLSAHVGRVTASAIDGRRMVPAVFARSSFGKLLALEGDRGAAAILQEGETVPADARWMIDVDTPEQLAALARYSGGSTREDQARDR